MATHRYSRPSSRKPDSGKEKKAVGIKPPMWTDIIPEDKYRGFIESVELLENRLVMGIHVGNKIYRTSFPYDSNTGLHSLCPLNSALSELEPNNDGLIHFDDIVGLECIFETKHNEKDGRTYCNISSFIWDEEEEEDQSEDEDEFEDDDESEDEDDTYDD